MTKRCPKCVNVALEVTHYCGEEIDVCRQCGGLWFEKNQVNRMIEEINDGPIGECYSHHFGEPQGSTELNCPDCGSHLEAVHLLKDYQTELDICRKCDGSWIDKDELTSVENSTELRGALDELNKKVSWKTYLFQFLTQMPVEYNLKTKSKSWVNWSLIAINILIFCAYYFNIESFGFVLENFALRPADVNNGQEIWTLLTCVFLHGSVMHLVGNMYFLYIIGDNLEDALGHKKYLMYYLICGIGASLFSLVMSQDPNIPSVGASGAIAGLFGMYLMWFRHASLTFMFVIYQKKLSAVWFFAIWIAINIFGLIVLQDGVDYGAHIGGFVVGLVIGYFLKEKVLAENPLIKLLNQPEAVLKR